MVKGNNALSPPRSLGVSKPKQYWQYFIQYLYYLFRTTWWSLL